MAQRVLIDKLGSFCYGGSVRPKSGWTQNWVEKLGVPFQMPQGWEGKAIFPVVVENMIQICNTSTEWLASSHWMMGTAIFKLRWHAKIMGGKREFSQTNTSCWCQLTWVAFTTQEGTIYHISDFGNLRLSEGLLDSVLLLYSGLDVGLGVSLSLFPSLVVVSNSPRNAKYLHALCICC